MSKFIVIIPARYASSRFPGKPLVEIQGKTMIRRVYEQALKSGAISKVYVATDDQRIFDHVAGFGGKVVMTSALHTSGTERCHEAYQLIASGLNKTFDVIINLQGDEPFINPIQIDLLTSCFTDPAVEIATLIKPITDTSSLLNPNVVKTLVGMQGHALYFSRAAVPFIRAKGVDSWIDEHQFFKHIGIYGWRTEVLQKLCTLRPTALEIAESLEQLRWIENGYRIQTKITDFETIAIDTPDDLLKLTNTP